MHKKGILIGYRVKGKKEQSKSMRILTIEYQLCKYVDHTAGMKSRQPNKPHAKTPQG